MKQWMAGKATAVLVGVLTWWPNIWVRSHAAPDLAFRKKSTLVTYGLDKYGSTLRDVLLLDGTHLNQELVKDGWCWWNRKYAPGIRYLKG